MTLIVGLGNPGKEYRWTRHNMGFLVLDAWARAHSLTFATRKFSAKIGTGAVFRKKVLLAKPMTFMNLSGQSIAPLVRYFKVPPEDLVIVHDDLDLAPGRVKIKSGGGDGGHQGLRSAVECLGTQEFVRVRVGIGRPPDGLTATEYVLEEFNGEEKGVLKETVERATRAVEIILSEGVVKAMNEFNR